MHKLYAGLGLILLLGLAFWYTRTTSYQDGVNAERVRWQDEILKVEKERDEYRQKAESTIVGDRIIWRDRIRTIQKTEHNCDLPEPIIRVLCDSGTFSGCGTH